MTLEVALANLQNPDPGVHLKAIRWLGVLGGPRAVAALIAALDHASADVRTGAGRALGSLGAREAVPALLRQFRQAEPVLDRAVYLEALADIGGDEAVETLIAALRDPNERIVEDACEALAALGDSRAIEPLRELLAHPDGGIRRYACVALVDLEAPDPRLEAAVESLAQSPDDEQRVSGRYLRQELARLREENSGEEDAAPPEERQRELETGLAELRDPKPQRRQEGARRLREVGGPEVVAALIAALEDPVPAVRGSVALALNELRSPEALPALIEHLRNDPAPGVRRMCVAFLRLFRDERADDALRRALEDSSPLVVCLASEQVGESGDPRAVPLLLPLLDHPDRDVRFSAANALLKLRAADPRLVAALEQLARDPEAEEYDLETAKWDQIYKRFGGSVPLPGQSMRELVEEARRLLAEERF
jgi:HEAT repeat protein